MTAARRSHAAAFSLLGLTLLSACESEEPDSPSPPTASAPVHERDPVDRALRTVTGVVFVEDGQATRKLDLPGLLEREVPRRVETMDPYYKRKKTFVGVPLQAVVTHLWSDFGVSSPHDSVELEAKDGYKVRLSRELSLHPRAFLAFYDLERSPFEPIGEGQADPAPLYLIWAGDQLTNLETHPRPWAIEHIRRVDGDTGLEKLVPNQGFEGDTPEKAGHAIFLRECVRCHSINQQGGKVGPDLNVPQNILEYRPVEQVRAYIRDPQTFRYSTMPAHPHLSNQNLDELVAYLRLMKDSKHDPSNQQSDSR